MKYRVSKMSRLTAIIITLSLVVSLAFGVMTYFGNTLEGGPGDILSSGGGSSSPVAGAGETYDPKTGLLNATTLEATDASFKSMGSVADGKVTYDALNRRRGTTSHENVTDNGTTSRFPSRYFEFPSYGAYDLSAALANSTAGATNRVFGIEQVGTFNSIQNNSGLSGIWDPNGNVNAGKDMSYQSKGDKLHISGDGSNVKKGPGIYIDDNHTAGSHGVVLYMTMALPESIVPDSDSIYLDFMFNVVGYVDNALIGTRRRADFGYGVIAETGEVGAAAPVFTEKNGADTSNGINRGNAEFGVDSTGIWKRFDSETSSQQIKNGYVDGYSSETAAKTYSWVVSNSIKIPANTKYLRFVIGWNAAGGGGLTAITAQAMFSNFRVGIRDTAPTVSADTTPDKVAAATAVQEIKYSPNGDKGESGVAVPDDNADTSKLKSIRYIDVHYLTKNNTLTTEHAFDQTNGFKISYYDPALYTVVTKTLSEIPMYNTPEGKTAKVFMQEKSLPDKAYINNTQMCTDLTGQTKAYQGTQGLHIRLGVRVRTIGLADTEKDQAKITGVNHGRTALNFVGIGLGDRSVDGLTGTDLHIDDEIPDASQFDITFDYSVYKNTQDVKYSYSNFEQLQIEDKPNRISLTKAYYYDFGENPIDTDVLSAPNNTEVAIEGFGKIIGDHTDQILCKLTHGKHNIAFYLRDGVGNMALIPVSVASVSSSGEAQLYGDASSIGTTSAAMVHGVTNPYTDEAKWITDDLSIVLNATPTTSNTADFYGGVAYYIMGYDPNSTYDGDTSKGILLSSGMMTKGTNTQDFTYLINKNLFKRIEVYMVNSVDHRDLSQLPSDTGLYKKVLINAVPGDYDFVVKRDDTTPVFKMTNYKDYGASNAYRSGLFNFNISFDTTGSVMFDTSNEHRIAPLVEFKLWDGTQYTWIKYNQESLDLVNDQRNQKYTFFFGANDKQVPSGKDWLPITFTDDKNTITGFDDGEYMSSYGKELTIRVSYPNREGEYYYCDVNTDKQVKANEDTNPSVKKIGIYVDNVKPEYELKAQYIELDINELYTIAIDAIENDAKIEGPVAKTTAKNDAITAIRAFLEATIIKIANATPQSTLKLYTKAYLVKTYGASGGAIPEDVLDTRSLPKSVTDVLDALAPTSETAKEYTVKAMVNNAWFWGTVGIRLTITNYDNILSKGQMDGQTLDIYRAGGEVIYEKITNDAAATGQNYITYTTEKGTFVNNVYQPNQSKLDAIERRLGFSIKTGSGVITKAVPENYNADTKPFNMKYDDHRPMFTFKIDGSEIKADTKSKWYTSNVAIDVEKQAYNGISTPTYTLTRDGVAVKGAFATSSLYSTNETNETTGVEYKMEAKNEAGKSYAITYIVKIDKTSDVINVLDWSFVDAIKNPEGIRYVTSDVIEKKLSPEGKIIKDNSIKVTVNKAFSTPSFFFVLSERTPGSVALANGVIKEKFEGETTGLTIIDATFNPSKEDPEAGYLSVDSIGASNYGNKFVYLVSKDEAGHFAVHTLNGDVNNNELRASIDAKTYTMTYDVPNVGYGNINNVAPVEVYDRNTGAPVTVELAGGLNISHIVKLTAEPAEGHKFLGWYVDTAEVPADDPNAPLTKYFGVDYKVGNTYEVHASIKRIVGSINILNNVQKNTGTYTYEEFYGTLNLAGESKNFTLNDTGVNKEVDGHQVSFESIGYLGIQWDGESMLDKLPQDVVNGTIGNYKYTIVLNQSNTDTMWLDGTYVLTFNIAEKDVINIIFDKSNATQSYQYNNEKFLTYDIDGENNVSTFFDVALFDAKDNYNKVYTNELVTALKTGSHKDTLEFKIFKYVGNAFVLMQDGESVVEVGSYKFTITQPGADKQPEHKLMTFTDYVINFSYEFTVKPREINIEAADKVVTKKYDKTTNVVFGEGDSWTNYIVASLSKNRKGDKTISVLLEELGNLTLDNILNYGTFKFDGADVNTRQATLSGVTKDVAYTNFTLGNVVLPKYNAVIEPKPITINGTNLLYDGKKYDGTLSVPLSREFADGTVKEYDFTLIANTNADVPTTYWWTADLKEGDAIKFILDTNALSFHANNVSVAGAENWIKVNDLGKVHIANVDGSDIMNYTIDVSAGGKIGIIENVKIDRATVTIKQNGIDTTHEFDGQRFRIGLDFEGLIGEDAKLGKYGIPLLFDEQKAVTYENINRPEDGVYRVGDTTPYPWNKGRYRVTLGESSDGKILVGYNYELDVVTDGSNYVFDFFTIVPKKLMIVIQNVDYKKMLNVKPYDGKPIGGHQVYSTNDATRKTNVSFIVTDLNNLGEATYLDPNYTVELDIVSEGVQVGKGYNLSIVSNYEVLYNGMPTENYEIVGLEEGDMKFDIIKRPIKVAPKNTTVVYRDIDTTKDSIRVELGDMTETDIWDVDPLGNLSVLTDEIILDEIARSTTFDIKFIIKNKDGSTVVENANVNKAGDKYDPALTYYFDLLSATIKNQSVENFDISSNESAEAFIKQAEYFVDIGSLASESLFNDDPSATMPSYKTKGVDYNVFTKEGVSVNDEELKKLLGGDSVISYFKVHAKGDAEGFAGYDQSGRPYPLSNGAVIDNVANFGVGTYAIRFKNRIEDTNNFTIANQQAGSNVIYPVAKTTVKGVTQYSVLSETEQQTVIKPISIRVMRNPLKGDYGKIDFNKVFSTYKVMYDDVQNDDIKKLFLAPNKAKSGSRMRMRAQNAVDKAKYDLIDGMVLEGKTEQTLLADLDGTEPINAGKYYMSFQNFMSTNPDDSKFYVKTGDDDNTINYNYSLEVYDKQYIEIVPVQVFVRFNASDMKQIYNGVTPSVDSNPTTAEVDPFTVFYDKYNDRKTDLTGRVYFHVKNDAINVNESGHAIVVDEVKNAGKEETPTLAQNLIPNGNYFLDVNNPILVYDKQNDTDVFKITKRPVYISMVRADDVQSNEATYGENGFNSMDGAFTYSIAPPKVQKDTSDVHNRLGSGMLDDVNTTVTNMFNSAGYKYTHVGDADGGRTALFNVEFLNIDFTNVSANYDFMTHLEEVTNFKLHKKVIYTKLYNNKDFNPTGQITYNNDAKVGQNDYSVVYSFNQELEGLSGATTIEKYTDRLDKPYDKDIDKLDLFLATRPQIVLVDEAIEGNDSARKFTVKLDVLSSSFHRTFAIKPNAPISNATEVEEATKPKNLDVILFEDGYYLSPGQPITFNLEKATINLDLGMADGFVGSVGNKFTFGNDFYIYNQVGTGAIAFLNPNQGNITPPEGEIKSPYVINAEGKITTDNVHLIGDYIIKNTPITTIKEIDGQQVEVDSGFLEFTITFSFSIDNDRYYNIAIDKSKASTIIENTNDKGEIVSYTKTMYIKKADGVKITVTKRDGAPATLTYGIDANNKHFFDYFTGKIENAASFDGLNSIDISSKYITFATREDVNAEGNKTIVDDIIREQKTSKAKLTIDEANLPKDIIDKLVRYYNFEVTPTDYISFNRGTIKFTEKADLDRTYKVDHVAMVEGKKPTENANFVSELKKIAERDKQYVLQILDKTEDPENKGQYIIRYKTPTEDGKANPLEFAKNSDGVYKFNLLDASDVAYSANSIYIVNEDYFVPQEKNLLFDYDMAFKIKINKCNIDVNMLYPRKQQVIDGKPQWNGQEPVLVEVPYSFEYGTMNSEIQSAMTQRNVEISAKDRSDKKFVIPNTNGEDNEYIIKLVFDTSLKVANDLKDAGTYKVNIQFNLTDAAQKNFILNKNLNSNPAYVGANQDVNYIVTPKELYVRADKTTGVKDTYTNELFTSIFGDVIERGDINNITPKSEVEYFKNAYNAGNNADIVISWYEKDENGLYTMKTGNRDKDSTINYSSINKDLIFYTLDTGIKYTAFDYKVGIKCTNNNYRISVLPMLMVAGATESDPMVKETAGKIPASGVAELVNEKQIDRDMYYTITPLTVTLENIGAIDKPTTGTANVRTYGATYGSLKSIFSGRDILESIATYDGMPIITTDNGTYKDWDKVPSLVRSVLYNNIRFKFTYSDGRDFNDAKDKENNITVNDSTILNAGTYKATFFTNYGNGEVPSIIINVASFEDVLDEASKPTGEKKYNNKKDIQTFDFTITKMDISDKIDVYVGDKKVVNDTVTVDYNGLWHDDMFRLVPNTSVISTSMITYTITNVNTGKTAEYVVCPTNGRLAPSKDINAGLILDAGQYIITVKVSDKKDKDKGKVVADNNLDKSTTYSFNYVVAPLTIDKLVNNGGKKKETKVAFNNAFRDDDIAISVTDSIVKDALKGLELSKDRFYITFSKYNEKSKQYDYEDSLPIMKTWNADKKVFERVTGYIRNVGTYKIRVYFTPNAINDKEFIKNYVPYTYEYDENGKVIATHNQYYEFEYIVEKKDIIFSFNDNEYKKSYKEEKEVMPADAGIAEFYLPDTRYKAGANNVAKANYTRKYINLADSTKTYTDVSKLPVGKYRVEFTVTPDGNYTALSNFYNIEVVPKNIDWYLAKNIKEETIDGKVIKTTETNGVQFSGQDVHFVKNDDNGNPIYKTRYDIGGAVVSVNSVFDIFKNLLHDKSYVDNILGVEIETKIGKEVKDTYKKVFNESDKTVVLPFKLNEAGHFTVNVRYLTDDNVIITKGSTFTVNVSQINVEEGSKVHENIVISNSTYDNEKEAYTFSFNGKTPDIEIALYGENIIYKDKNNKDNPDGNVTYVDLATNKVVEKPIAAGKYQVTITFLNNIGVLNGEKKFDIEITPVDMTFEFDKTNASEMVYSGEDYDITYTTSDSTEDKDKLLKVEYYKVEGETETLLEKKPIDAGSYVAKVAFVHEVAKDAVNNVNITSDVAKQSFAYTIKKAEYDKDSIIVSAISERKVYDGRMAQIIPNPAAFVGLPKDAKLSLDTSGIRRVGHYDLIVTVESPNYNTFELPYGTYDINKGMLTIDIQEKTTDSITIKKPSLDRSVKVMYKLGDGEWQKENVFEDLKPNKTYTIYMKVEGANAKNFVEGEISTEVSTVSKDVPSLENIVVVGIGVVAVVAVGVVLGIIRHIRKKRKV